MKEIRGSGLAYLLPLAKIVGEWRANRKLGMESASPRTSDSRCRKLPIRHDWHSISQLWSILIVRLRQVRKRAWWCLVSRADQTPRHCLAILRSRAMLGGTRRPVVSRWFGNSFVSPR